MYVLTGTVTEIREHGDVERMVRYTVSLSDLLIDGDYFVYGEMFIKPTSLMKVEDAVAALPDYIKFNERVSDMRRTLSTLIVHSSTSLAMLEEFDREADIIRHELRLALAQRPPLPHRVLSCFKQLNHLMVRCSEAAV